MKLKRQRKPADPDQPTENFRTVRGPYKGHATHDYDSHPKLTKAQRARRKQQLREKYGPQPETARPTTPMGGEQRKALRQQVLQEAGYCCQRCGSGHHLTIDHRVPRHLGGGNHLDNLRCLCYICNKQKGCKLPVDGEFE